jgi:hypothetical protein
MIKIQVTKNGVVTNSAQFETQVECDAWVAENAAVKSFGKPERWVHEKDLTALGEDKTLALEFVESGEPESLEKVYKFAAEYTITQSDVTVEVEQEKKIETRLQKQAVGATVIAIATEINDAKNYTQTQLNDLLADQGLVTIERLAWSGSLVLLQAAITGYSGTFYDAADKAKLLAPITAYLGS